MLSLNFVERHVLPAQKKITFTAGEVKFWTDFDGTLFPIDSDDLHSKKVVKKLTKYFNDINNFFQNTNGKAELNITTGRNYISFYNIYKKLLNSGILIGPPDKVVTSNGKDIFIKSNNTKGCPDYKDVDLEKQRKIEALTNWKEDLIRNAVVKYFKDLNIPLGQPRNTNPRVKEIIFPVLRNDGELQICIDIPNNLMSESFVDNLTRYLKDILNSNNVKYKLTFEDYNPMYERGPSIIVEPLVQNMPLDKAYDIKEALNKAKKEKDLVIVAGDYKNDLTMLNPETYVNSPEEINNLPLRSIVVGNNPILLELAKKYPDKVIVTNKFNLLKAIKSSISNYVSTNKTFDLKEEIKIQLNTKHNDNWVSKIKNFFKSFIERN